MLPFNYNVILFTKPQGISGIFVQMHLNGRPAELFLLIRFFQPRTIRHYPYAKHEQ